MTETEFTDVAQRLLEAAQCIVYHLESRRPAYEKLTGFDAENLRDWAHNAHKLAVKLAKEFED